MKEKDTVVTTDAEMKSDLDKPVDNEKEVEMNVDRQIPLTTISIPHTTEEDKKVQVDSQRKKESTDLKATSSNVLSSNRKQKINKTGFTTGPNNDEEVEIFKSSQTKQKNRQPKKGINKYSEKKQQTFTEQTFTDDHQHSPSVYYKESHQDETTKSTTSLTTLSTIASPNYSPLNVPNSPTKTQQTQTPNKDQTMATIASSPSSARSATLSYAEHAVKQHIQETGPLLSFTEFQLIVHQTNQQLKNATLSLEKSKLQVFKNASNNDDIQKKKLLIVKLCQDQEKFLEYIRTELEDTFKQ